MGHLEPLTLVRVSVAHGRSMDQITEAEVVDAFPAVKNGYENAARGLYVAELIDGFSALSVANAELFNLAVETLEALVRRETPISRCDTSTCSCSDRPVSCPNSTFAWNAARNWNPTATVSPSGPAEPSAPNAARLTWWCGRCRCRL
jgi:hypothetical protein